MTDRILLITAGRGPSECNEAVVKAARILVEEANEREVAISLSHDLHEPLPSIVVHLDGTMAIALADRWIGTVAMVDPTARGRGGRKNFFIAVHPLPHISEPVRIDPADIRFETMRAGGPGGQHQNTTDSAVRATHVPTGLTTLARDGRSQHRNKAIAIARLEALASGIHEVEKSRSDREGWLKRIDVERGRPVRMI